MRSSIKSIAFLTVFLTIASAFCQPDIPATLKTLLQSRIEAISRKDTVKLAEICTRNYQSINAAGEKMTLVELKKAVMQAESPVKLSTIISFQPFIAEDESMAFAIFEIEEEVAENASTITKNSLIITEIYRKEKKRWKVQLTHSSQKICLVPN